MYIVVHESNLQILQLHVFYTSAFLWLGYKAHQYEERAEENYEDMVKKHKNVPWWPRAQLLAERAERLKTEKEGICCQCWI